MSLTFAGGAGSNNIIKLHRIRFHSLHKLHVLFPIRIERICSRLFITVAFSFNVEIVIHLLNLLENRSITV